VSGVFAPPEWFLDGDMTTVVTWLRGVVVADTVRDAVTDDDADWVFECVLDAVMDGSLSRVDALVRCGVV